MQLHFASLVAIYCGLMLLGVDMATVRQRPAGRDRRANDMVAAGREAN